MYHNLLAIHFTLIRIQINHLNNMWNFKKTHMSSFHKRNKHNEVFPCYKRIRKIETVFKRLKIIRAKHWQCLTKSYLTQYLNPEQHTDRLCHKMKLPYIITIQFLNWGMICKDTVCLLSNDAEQKLITKASFLLKKTYIPIPGLIYLCTGLN